MELDVKKLDLAVANGMVKSLTYNQANGVFTITYLNGSSDTIDTKLEKLAVNFSYDPTAQQLIITLDDGTTQKVDMSALITQYEFLETDTVAFSVDGGGKVSANVKNGSITEDRACIARQLPPFLSGLLGRVGMVYELHGTGCGACCRLSRFKVFALKTSKTCQLSLRPGLICFLYAHPSEFARAGDRPRLH